MPIFGEKPVTSITIKINQLSQPHRYDDDDDIDDSPELQLSNLLELIKIQPSSGATEAARAIRKKIKYGESVEEQIRALNILELLILNSGRKIGPIIARDDKLIDVLKGILTGSGKTGLSLSYDKEVQQKVKELAIGWKTELEELEGYKYFACLWQFIPKSKSKHGRTSSRSISSPAPSSSRRTVDADYDDDDNTDDYRRSNQSNRNHGHHDNNGYEDDEYDNNAVYDSPKYSRPKSPPPPRPRVSSPYNGDNGLDKSKDKQKDKKDKKKKKKGKIGVKYADEEFEIPQINYTLEAPKIRTLIGQCHTHTTGLTNALIVLPAGESPLDNDKIRAEFDKCKKIRRKVLRYLQFVGAGGEANKTAEVIAMDEEFLGSLIGANELLVESFKQFDAKCGIPTVGVPAPTYGEEEEDDDDESYSGESYYDSEDSDEEEASEQSISQRLQNTTIEGSSSQPVVDYTIPRKSPPPPRPSKPSKLISRASPAPVSYTPPPAKQSIRKSQPIADDNDPFGDNHAVQHERSIYD
ncbi:uncharacterized protein RJT21DRAFT_13212 [Scheffersomyces amazonensis]|uniref:uncharacterized protein n=1 Tax=Scheffersomyces amazonensis TaxID=1078765 RepID=UPI00315C8E69